LLRVPSGGTMSCTGPSAFCSAAADAATRLLDVPRSTAMPPSQRINPPKGQRKIEALPIQ